MSPPARHAVNVAQQLAKRSDGFVQIHELLVAWAHDLPYAECALARALNDSSIFPGLSEILRDREMAAQEMISERRSTGITVAGLVNDADAVAGAERSEFTLESHIGAALCRNRDNELGSLGLRIDRFLKYVRDTEVSGPDRTPEIFVKGQRFDALRLVGRTIERANRDLLLVDGYISSSVLDLFTEKRPDVSIRILTKQVRPAVLKAAAAFAQDYGHIGIRLNDTIHDRFLVVDDSLFFHLGASVKDVGEKTFRISQIESAQEIQKLRTALAKAWSEGGILFEL